MAGRVQKDVTEVLAAKGERVEIMKGEASFENSKDKFWRQCKKARLESNGCETAKEVSVVKTELS